MGEKASMKLKRKKSLKQIPKEEILNFLKINQGEEKGDYQS